MIDGLVFGLAEIAFALLAAAVVLGRAGHEARGLRIAAAFVALAHTFGVWAHRFGFDFGRATDGRWAGFLVFHGALVLIVTAALTRPPWPQRLLPVAFLAVGVGAVGAVFHYEVVAPLRLPTLVIAVLTPILTGLAPRWRPG